MRVVVAAWQDSCVEAVAEGQQGVVGTVAAEVVVAAVAIVQGTDIVDSVDQSTAQELD